MKKKILTVIGARPQIIKAAAFSRAVGSKFQDRIEEIILHTGQHYDANMSQVFFDELGIPKADYNLHVGSAPHGEQTAAMIKEIERVIHESKPHALLVYGDTNSTLAGALAASKMHIPIIHVEAGLRSFDKTMPEEINRIMTDHVSTLLFAPTPTAVENLIREGFRTNENQRATMNNPLIVHTGDVMYDNALHYGKMLKGKIEDRKPFILATIHRDHNTDHPERLKSLMQALAETSEKCGLNVLLPLHPRTRMRIAAEEIKGWKFPPQIEVIDPVSYLEMIALESACSLVITDSGGVQKEAYFFKKPCVILRPHTEWKEIVAGGQAVLAGESLEKIAATAMDFLKHEISHWPEIFGDGHAAEHMAQTILDKL
jgi:UDP-GlcNAc3NAcA epimerase